METWIGNPAPHKYKIRAMAMAVGLWSCCTSAPLTAAASSSPSIPTLQAGVRGSRTSFFAWEARSHLGSSSSSSSSLLPFCSGFKNYLKSSHSTIIQASLFGVGAPEAIVIGVVALVVFGPKGLAEIARSIGKSLRAFQPTLRELQEVSREFKDTLEQEMGLDELRSYESKYPENNVKSSQQFQSPMHAKQDLSSVGYVINNKEQESVPVSTEQQEARVDTSPVTLNNKDVEYEKDSSEASENNITKK